MCNSEGLGEILLENKIYVSDKTPCYGLNCLCSHKTVFWSSNFQCGFIRDTDFVEVVSLNEIIRPLTDGICVLKKRVTRKLPFSSMFPVCRSVYLCLSYMHRERVMSKKVAIFKSLRQLLAGNESASTLILDFPASKL